MTDAIATAFANRALIPACEAARVLGIDAKTLRNLVRGGAIRTVTVGRVERFTEADLRACKSEPGNRRETPGASGRGNPGQVPDSRFGSDPSLLIQVLAAKVSYV